MTSVEDINNYYFEKTLIPPNNVKELQDRDKHYEKLYEILMRAYQQVSIGKGNERHAYGLENFEDQLICEMDRRLGSSTAGPLYQAVKKCYESIRLDPEKAKHELYGAINYIAAAIQILDEK